MPSPQPILNYLQNYDDAKEQQLDIYLYHLTASLAEFSCSVDFESIFADQAFDRYGDEQGSNPDEIEILDLLSNYPAFYTIADGRFDNAGLNLSTALADFTWEGYTYVPTIWLENKSTANWSKPIYFGVGTDVVYPDSVADFIPVISNEECPTLIELIVGKVDQDKVQNDPIPYESECLENPLLIVQLGWAKTKKAFNAGNPNQYLGDIKDTVIPGATTGPNCTRGPQYTYLRGNIGGKRYERSDRSEFKIESFTIPIGTTNISWGQYPYVSVKESLRDVHKNDKNKTFDFNRGIMQTPRQLALVGLNTAQTSTGGVLAYAATYEHDWYCKNRDVTFDAYRGRVPTLQVNRKGDHEHYQLIHIIPTWCAESGRVYTVKTGRGEVFCD